MAAEEIKKQYQKEDACLLNECYSKVDKEIEKLSDDEWTKFYNIILPKKRKEFKKSYTGNHLSRALKRAEWRWKGEFVEEVDAYLSEQRNKRIAFYAYATEESAANCKKSLETASSTAPLATEIIQDMTLSANLRSDIINQLLKVNDVDILRSISSIINKNDGKTDNNTTVDKNIIEYISWEIEDSTMSIIDLVEKAEHLNNEFFNKYHLGTVPEDSVDKEKAVMFYYMKDQMKEVTNRKEAEETANANLKKIEKVAEDVIAKEGRSYTVNAFIGPVDFPVKTYGAYSFPAGTYEAVEVVIGEGAGKNWWCVMYPNMCFQGSMYEVIDEKAETSLQEVLTQEEYDSIIEDSDYKIQFKYLSFLNHYL